MIDLMMVYIACPWPMQAQHQVWGWRRRCSVPLLPLTSILLIMGNSAPLCRAKFLMVSLSPGSWPANCSSSLELRYPGPAQQLHELHMTSLPGCMGRQGLQSPAPGTFCTAGQAPADMVHGVRLMAQLTHGHVQSAVSMGMKTQCCSLTEHLVL